MKKHILAVAAAVAMLVSAATISEAAAPPKAVAAKKCSSGWKHAVIGGEHKCLRRGQYCAKRYDSQYHRYGYHCHGSRLS